MITLSNAGKIYSDEVTIGPVELEIPRGGITALVGPNGAGKSTLLTLIGRLLKLDSGVIEVAGMDVNRTKSEDLAKILSILRQENHFITRLTVRQLVGFGRFPHSKGRLTATDNEHIDQAIDFLDLGELQERYLDELSGGQRQRAYVAMVLAQDTDYILLDEPLAGIDPIAVGEIRDLVKHLKDRGIGVLITDHNVRETLEIIDRAYILHDGQVLMEGEPRDIVAHEGVRRVYLGERFSL